MIFVLPVQGGTYGCYALNVAREGSTVMSHMFEIRLLER